MKALSIPGHAAGQGPTEPVRSPYSGKVLDEVEMANDEARECALDVTNRALADRAGRLPLHRRTSILRRTAELMREERQGLALTIVQEGGKPLTDALVEVDRATAGMETLAGDAERVAGEQVPMGATAATDGRLAFTLREPIGVVAAISAFNHPLNLIVHQAGPAIAAGCPVIIKPAPETPLSCLAFVELVRKAGLPEPWCIALPTSVAVAERLATSHHIAYLSFIGSAKVGWMLRSKLAPGVRCALEHGGAAPVIVDASADLERAVPLILKGGYYHAGQVCVSVQRVFVHASRKDELVERLTAGVLALETGDPALPSTDVGPLIRRHEVPRVHSWVQDARNAGATIACGGEPTGHQCYAPTLLVDTPPEMACMRQEIFGPVVNVVGVDSLGQAVAHANSLPWAFQAAIFAEELGPAIEAAKSLDASAVMVNDHSAFRADWMPFGGRRQSGLGVGGLGYSTLDMTQPKLVVIRS